MMNLCESESRKIPEGKPRHEIYIYGTFTVNELSSNDKNVTSVKTVAGNSLKMENLLDLEKKGMNEFVRHWRTLHGT